MVNHSVNRFHVVIIGVVLALVGIGLSLLLLHTNVYAQDPPAPTPALDPVHRANIELAEVQISSVRGLPIAVVNKQAVVREDFDQLIQAELERRYSPEDARIDQLFYQALGFLPMGIELYPITTSVVTTAPSDYYDPATNTIFMLPSGGSTLTLGETMRYGQNYMYALLEDQFRAFGQLADSPNTDQAMAIRAVIEGDKQFTLERLGTLLIESNTYSLENLLGQAATFRSRDLPGSPPAILVEEAYFGPQIGYGFVRGLYNETNTWRLVNLLYERPPLSTEHIFHPTLYLLYEEPHIVEVAPMDAFWQANDDPNWQLVTERVAGEFYLRQHLALIFEATVVDQVASGWGGDKLAIYATPDDQALMVWRISWDTTTDFNEFSQQYGAFIGNWLVIGGIPYQSGIICWEGSDRSICQMNFGEDVLIVSAPTLELAQAAITFQFVNLNPIFG